VFVSFTYTTTALPKRSLVYCTNTKSSAKSSTESSRQPGSQPPHCTSDELVTSDVGGSFWLMASGFFWGESFCQNDEILEFSGGGF
jgi:hypothetical protein